ncbi:MAG: EamA family transporter [Spirulina sp. SIO3F2]|nr:EamA family transporter [Spirulina sp. SIO3F2]
MGQQDRQPDDLGMEMTEDDAKQSLRGITEELEHLKHSLVQQLTQEIEQLQERKMHLLAETESLNRQREEQLTQQQELAQQLAPAIAEQLLAYIRNQTALPAEGEELPALGQSSLGDGNLSQYNENAYRMITSLDTTLRTTFRTLEQDVSSYQSTLSQQLGQMYSLEQQAQVILDALVSRIRAELQADSSLVKSPPPVMPPQTYNQGVVVPERQPELPLQKEPRPVQRQTAQQPSVRPAPPKSTPKATKKKVGFSQLQLGFILVLMSSFFLSLQNVVMSIILNTSSLFGQFEMGGVISPNFGNSLFILFLRMVVVVPTMAILSQYLYPSSWQEIQQFLRSGDRRAFWNVTSCGFFLFASSALIYMALGSLTPGVALTLFFVFPIVTVFGAWINFGDRPSIIRWTATFIVFLGIALITLSGITGDVRLSSTGIIYALGAGITFALHVLQIQACTKRLHPVPFSVINFGVILAFCTLSVLPLLVFDLPDTIDIVIDMSKSVGIGIFSLVLGGLTLISYLTNNIGIRYIGAARASIVGATGPALTSLLSWLLIQSSLNKWQILGMLIVTIGVLAQNAEKLFKKPTPKKS